MVVSYSLGWVRAGDGAEWPACPTHLHCLWGPLVVLLVLRLPPRLQRALEFAEDVSTLAHSSLGNQGRSPDPAVMEIEAQGAKA